VEERCSDAHPAHHARATAAQHRTCHVTDDASTIATIWTRVQGW